MMARIMRDGGLVFLGLAVAGCSNENERIPATTSTVAVAPAELEISHVPEVVYTSVQGAYIDPGNPPAQALAKTRQLSWLFHLVIHSPNEGYEIENVEIDFMRDGNLMWQERLPRSYLEQLSWLVGGIEYNTEYFLDNIEFVNNQMRSVERPAGPAVPAGGTVTWARIDKARPYFARIDQITFRFDLLDDANQRRRADHTVPIVEWDQSVNLRLPFEGTWIAKSGNDLETGHRRTGLNGLTTYGWDFMKVGDDGRTFRTDGKTPEDYYTYDAPVLAPADGTVVHVRNDIDDFGIGETPPRELLEEDGDVFAGNLVVIDHGNGEYTLTSHMLAGTIPVSIGDRVTARQPIGRVGNSGASMAPHIHINLMDGPKWLKARGIPSLFSDFERIEIAGSTEYIKLGNPMSGWLVRPRHDERTSQ
jgi:hypothetical protein